VLPPPSGERIRWAVNLPLPGLALRDHRRLVQALPGLGYRDVWTGEDVASSSP
jgi:hypothetical protein